MKRVLHRPKPIHHPSASPIDHNTSALEAARRLVSGETLRVTDAYGTGAEILAQVEQLLPNPPPSAPFAERQQAKKQFRTVALRLLAPISSYRVALRDARSIGFLEMLYVNETDFYLPFLQIQEFHGAWNRYLHGTHLAVLGHRVHPFFGTYAPTRTSHLELFGTWLSQYTGARSRAVDIGTGCGVLSFMLCKAGFESVLATDINPNAIESVRLELERHRMNIPLELCHGDLFGADQSPTDIVVFNPPWMKGSTDTALDRALHFDDDTLFERFFEAAHSRLTPNGRIVLVFSNILQLIQPDVPHPIETELAHGRTRLVQKLKRKVKPTKGPDGKRRRTKEKVEIWELAKA